MKKKDLSSLFVLIEAHLDMKEVERILLLMEQDRVDFTSIRETYVEEKKEITFFEKLNPFSEREQKGEVLKLKVQLEDIASLYEKERKQIIDMGAHAILQVPAFVAKERYLNAIKSIDDIWASGPRGATVYGRNKAKEKTEELAKSLIDIYGDDFRLCPTMEHLLSKYMTYLLTPFQLPQELNF